jgi:hypothetical protein
MAITAPAVANVSISRTARRETAGEKARRDQAPLFDKHALAMSKGSAVQSSMI